MLNLLIQAIKEQPQDRPSIIYIKDKLSYIYKLYQATNEYETKLPLKFTGKAKDQFENEFKIYYEIDKIRKIEELSKSYTLFKEIEKKYVIILSNYAFLCLKDKGPEDGYFFVTNFEKAKDIDYRYTQNITDTIFTYYSHSKHEDYDNPKNFIEKLSAKKVQNYKETKDIKQEDILLRSTKNVIDNKKIYYKTKVTDFNRADNLLKLHIIDDEKFIIKDNKKTIQVLEKYLQKDIPNRDLGKFITDNITDLQQAVEDENNNKTIEDMEICNIFDGAIEKKDNIQMVLKQGDNIIISNDKGDEYSGILHSYNNNLTELDVKLAEELLKKFAPGDEYNICYDYQMKDTIYKKQKDAFEELKDGISHIDGILKKITEPVKYLFTYDLPPNHNDEYYNTLLDDNQKEAVNKALSLRQNSEFLLIQGPPGTGKTTVITEIVKQYLKKDGRSKILVASQSNQAVDNVLEKVCEEHKVLRIGRDIKKMSKIAEKYSEQKVLGTIIRKNMAELKCIKPLEHYQEEYYNILSNINDKNMDGIKPNKTVQYFLAPIRVIFATLIGVSSWKNFRDIVFDLVIIDEAGRALLSEIAVPIRKTKHIILVGDQKQLAPVMDDEVIEDVDKNKDEENYKEDLLNYSFFGKFYDRLKENPNAHHFLKCNYRAHSTICKLYSDAFYDGLLQSNKEQDCLKHHGLSLYKSSVVLLDTKNIKERFDEQCGTGKRNLCNANIIKKNLHNIINNIKDKNLKHKTIGIITPYTAQRDLLKRVLKNIIKNVDISIDIGTVDSFQGSDRDYIIYDSVRSSRTISNIKFISDEKRLNVSLSRAKELLVIVADSKFLNTASKGDSKWPKIINMIQTNPGVYETKTLKEGD